MDKWFKFETYSRPSCYGFGTEDAAAQYVEILNAGRDFNHYGYREMGASETAEILNLLDAEGIDLGESVNEHRQGSQPIVSMPAMNAAP